MSSIFSPIKINSLYLNNRIVFPPICTNFGINGAPSRATIAWHVERAKFGVGLNMLEATFLECTRHNYRLALDDDSLIPQFSKLCDEVHLAGGSIGIQLQHQGRNAAPDVTGCVKRLVSIVPGLTPDAPELVLTTDDIKTLIEKHVDTVRRAIKAGIDLVELHGAHGFILAQFMSPLTNKREDDYGGSFENRMRFVNELVAAVRQEAGDAYPLAIRLSIDEMYNGGLTVEDTKLICADLVKNGIDAISFSAGIRESYEYAIPPAMIAEGWLIEKCKKVKEFIRDAVPVMVAGRINSLALAEKIVSEKYADLVGIGRSLIADPQFIIKSANGLVEEIMPCVGCNNRCIRYLEDLRPISCAVNPRAGKESLYPLGIKQTDLPRNILVIGGGVAGLEAALVSAKRGHKVTLLEKSDSLGGLAKIASIPPHKNSYEKVIDRLEKAAREAGVIIRLNFMATPENIMEFKADHVILAMGSKPELPDFAKKSNVSSAEEILKNGNIKGKVLIMGGGNTGFETAFHLRNKGCDVTIVKRSRQIAPAMEWRWRKLILNELGENNFKIIYGHKVVKVGDDNRILLRELDADGKELNEIWTEKFDYIINALGYTSLKPDNLTDFLQNSGVSVTNIGDSKKVGLIGDAMQDAWECAHSL